MCITFPFSHIVCNRVSAKHLKPGQTFIRMGCGGSSTAESSFAKKPSPLDLREDPSWDPANVWVCDIEERPDESNCDFLFEAALTADGTTEIKTDGSVSNWENFTAGKCVFSQNMYDIQSFKPDTDNDGNLNFSIKFGMKTRERLDAPDGWSVEFVNLTKSSARNQSFEGTMKTSWWGERKVKLINYTCLTPDEYTKYPDLIADYYKSVGMQRRPLQNPINA